ncbi:MAG: hypothetical protein SO424_02060 [[Pasteurella] aerogenes]|nr:hypothetical protein [[Pasteurella] aerogenes]
MNKLFKVGATLLFALFLAACNKVDPAAELKKLEDWSTANQQEQATFQADLQKKMASGDLAQIEQAAKEFNDNITKIEQSLDAVEVKNDEVKALKTKMQETLKLSSSLVQDGVELLRNPSQSPEKVAAVQKKTEETIKSSQEVLKLRSELAEKFNKK